MFDWLLVHILTLQTIVVNQTQACFFNYTQGVNIWENCGVGKDWLQAFLLPWEWVTGGYFSMIVVGVLILTTYIKYQKVIYPMIIGIVFLPISYFAFPNLFVIWGIVLGVGAGLGILIAWIFTSQTNEQ